jgi:hypothetical protein
MIDVKTEQTLVVGHLGALMITPPPCLDTVTLRPTPSDTVTICPTNVFILRQSDPTGVGQSDHTQTAQFDPLEVGLNVSCDNPTHIKSDPFSALPGGLGDSLGNDTQMALIINGAAPPERTSPVHGSAGRELDLTKPSIWRDPPNRTPPSTGQWCLFRWGRPYPGLG